MHVVPFGANIDEIPSKELIVLPLFREAYAFGLPVITTDTGGISGVIEQGKNGFVLPLDADASSYAELIKEIFLDDNKYHELSKSSRKTFDEKLNWDSWRIEVSKLISRIIK